MHWASRRDDAIGLSSVLIGADLEDALERVDLVDGTGTEETRYLTLLRGGPQPPNPSELLESARMQDVLDRLSAGFDIVIIDTPPVGLMSDALSLFGLVSGIVVVSALGKTTYDSVHDVVRQVDLVGGHLLGVVANFAPPSDRSGSAYYHG